MEKHASFVVNPNGSCRFCTKADDERSMVQCDDCDRWFHHTCAGLKRLPEPHEPFLCRLIEVLSVRGSDHQAKRATLMKLPTFEGRARDWPTFKRTFEETTRQGRYTLNENLHRLQQALKGNAEREVRSLMLDAANVPAIMERLEKGFGHPEFVYEELLKDVTRVRVPDSTRIPELANAVDNLVVNMKALGQDAYLNDPRLVKELVQKMPLANRTKWVEDNRSAVQPRNLDDLNEWLKPLAETMRMVKPTREDTVNLHDESRAVQTTRRVSPASPASPACPACPEKHRVEECEDFQRMSTGDRIDMAKRERLCFGCLRAAKHMPAGGAGQTEEGASTAVVFHHSGPRRTFYQMVPVTLRNGPIEMSALAFLDCGSSLTLIDEEAADRLGLGGYHDPLMMKWTHDISRQEKESRRVKVTVQGPSGHPYVLKGVRTVKTLQLPAQGLDVARLQKYPHLRDVPLASYDQARPTILIGLGHSHLLMGLDRRMGAANEPMAVRTKLGWVVFGTEQMETDSDDYTAVHEEAEMNRMIARYFTTEDFGVKAAPAVESEDVVTARKTLESTLVRRGDSFEVGLLWRSNRMRFPDSYQNALHRLEGLEKKLKKRPDLQAWALRTFQEYVGKGYIRKLTPSELLREDVFYIPHFIVEGKKPRIVFDAAAQVRGVSLNSQLLSGPDNLTPLFGVLIRCREQQIAVAGDIQEMFHRVKVRESDQHFQRILWRDCESGRQPDVYVVRVLTFGATCSPSCAQAAKNKNAEELADRYPLAKDAIQCQHYVDDYIDSFASLSTAKDTVAQVMRAHDEGGFRIRNFISSSKELLASVPEDRRSSGAQLMLEEKAASYERILGVFWDIGSDRFGFRTNYQRADPAILEHSRPPTKREALSFVMSLYDPLGLVSHVTIQGRILMREVHVATEEWDEPIPDRLCGKWESFVRQLEALKGLTVPRCIKLPAAEGIRLHTFVDASEDAFAACVYASSTANAQRYVQLIAAKARVAPVAQLSIPRLELQAAVLGTRLALAVGNELRLAVESSTFWSDSRTVLAWIQSRHRKYKQFVAHRVNEILATTRTEQWRWVPSGENPADIATKEVSNTAAWFDGPAFLLDNEDKWPVVKSGLTTDEEATVAAHEEDTPLRIEDAYSDWRRLIRHIAVLNKFVRFLRERGRGSSFEKRFSMANFEKARRAMYRKAQQDVST
ncbi:hypothetical protein AND_007967 [Anopheles darlingi]|uniref:Zinc finger PHD-type domain-containing protein n=1 Tax=Anopheles darlingi TaxID=43151 RepID=W5J8X7_ANODA|nr:hypothetical protein AND_007967 [Anopheles darlingi]